MNSFSNVNEIKNLTRSEFEAGCIQNVDHLYIGNDTVLCKVLARHKMYVDTKDMGIAPHLIMDGYWESWLSLLMAQIIRPGFICLDIGANFGYFSILMSELAGETGRTLVLEPNPRIAELLRATSFVNGNHFEVLQMAMSDKKGEAVLTITDRELGGGTIKPNDLVPGRSQVAVPTISVDELVKEKNLPRVDLMKIDVEGVEPLVFQGMKETIANNPDIQIIVEYSPSIYTNAQEFTEYLFDTFTVYQAKNVDSILKLSKADIPRLLSIPDHTDLYLKRS